MHVEIPPCPLPDDAAGVWAVIDYDTSISTIMTVRLVVGWAAAVRLVLADYRSDCEDDGAEYDEANALRQLAGGELVFGQFRVYLEAARAYDEHFCELAVTIGKPKRPRKAKPPARLMPPPPSAN